MLFTVAAIIIAVVIIWLVGLIVIWVGGEKFSDVSDGIWGMIAALSFLAGFGAWYLS